MDKVTNPGCTLESSGELLLDAHAWYNQRYWIGNWGWDLNISSKQQLKPDLEHWTGSKLWKEFVKAVYCHTAYLTYLTAEYIMRNAGLDEAQAGINTAGKKYQ